MSAVYTYKEVAEEQKEPLDYKIQKAVRAVGTAFSLSRGAVGLAFSGATESLEYKEASAYNAGIRDAISVLDSYREMKMD